MKLHGAFFNGKNLIDYKLATVELTAAAMTVISKMTQIIKVIFILLLIAVPPIK